MLDTFVRDSTVPILYFYKRTAGIYIGYDDIDLQITFWGHFVYYFKGEYLIRWTRRMQMRAIFYLKVRTKSIDRHAKPSSSGTNDRWVRETRRTSKLTYRVSLTKGAADGSRDRCSKQVRRVWEWTLPLCYLSYVTTKPLTTTNRPYFSSIDDSVFFQLP